MPIFLVLNGFRPSSDYSVLIVLIVIVLAMTMVGCSTAYQHSNALVLAATENHSDLKDQYISKMPTYVERLRPGDIISIENNFTRDRNSYRIGAAGRFYYPNAGEIDTSDLTPGQVADELYSRLSEVYKYPHVTVNLIEPASSDVYVSGDVARPGNFSIFPGETISQVLIKAGGLGVYARSNQVVLLRKKSDSRYVAYMIDLRAASHENQSGVNDVTLYYGDIVYVPRSRLGGVVDFMNTYFREINPIDLSIGAFYQLNDLDDNQSADPD